jgi:hypothetical protein
MFYILQEQIKDVIASSVECNEHKETAVTSVKQSMLKEPSTEATGKMKSDLRTTSGDNKSNSQSKITYIHTCFLQHFVSV